MRANTRPNIFKLLSRARNQDKSFESSEFQLQSCNNPEKKNKIHVNSSNLMTLNKGEKPSHIQTPHLINDDLSCVFKRRRDNRVHKNNYIRRNIQSASRTAGSQKNNPSKPKLAWEM